MQFSYHYHEQHSAKFHFVWPITADSWCTCIIVLYFCYWSLFVWYECMLSVFLSSWVLCLICGDLSVPSQTAPLRGLIMGDTCHLLPDEPRPMISPPDGTSIWPATTGRVGRSKAWCYDVWVSIWSISRPVAWLALHTLTSPLIRHTSNSNLR